MLWMWVPSVRRRFRIPALPINSDRETGYRKRRRCGHIHALSLDSGFGGIIGRLYVIRETRTRGQSAETVV